MGESWGVGPHPTALSGRGELNPQCTVDFQEPCAEGGGAGGAIGLGRGLQVTDPLTHQGWKKGFQKKESNPWPPYPWRKMEFRIC